MKGRGSAQVTPRSPALCMHKEGAISKSPADHWRVSNVSTGPGCFLSSAGAGSRSELDGRTPGFLNQDGVLNRVIPAGRWPLSIGGPCSLGPNNDMVELASSVTSTRNHISTPVRVLHLKLWCVGAYPED